MVGRWVAQDGESKEAGEIYLEAMLIDSQGFKLIVCALHFATSEPLS